ncbi:HNH endonuclease [bacterium]|nr:HNH endonuclease [bacterium]
MQVHHLTYKSFGNEELEDLVTVCEKCHEKIHNKKFSYD